MKIKTKVNGLTRYYVATNNGRAIVGSKGHAADLPADQAPKVLEQLRTIAPSAFDTPDAELVP